METWKDIPGYEGLYQVSDCGNVRSLARITMRADGKRLPVKGRVLKQQKSFDYNFVTLYKGSGYWQEKTHRLVMLAFCGECPPTCEVHHIDGNGRNNNINNLEYVDKGTHLKKIHATTISGRSKGEKNVKAKLDSGKVKEAKALIDNGLSLKAIARLFGVADTTIAGIKHGKTWKHLKEE